MAFLTNNAFKNDGTMDTGSGGGGGGSVTIDSTYPPVSTNISTVPSTSVVTALFNNVANPATATNLSTSALGPVTVGSTLRTINLPGSTVSINGSPFVNGGDVSGNNAFGTAANSEVVIGNIDQNIRMNSVKTQVFGTLAVSSTEGFVPQAFPLHVEGTAKFGGTITVGVGNSVINGTYNMPTGQAPTLTNTTTVATIGTVTSTYNFLNTNTIPNQILNSSNVSTNSPSPVVVGNTARTLNLQGSTVSINGVAYVAGGGGGSGGDVSANNTFGTTALSAVTVGNSARTLTLNGSTVNTQRLQLLGSANNTGVEFINTPTIPSQTYDINIASWGDFNISGTNSAGTILSYSPTNSLLRLGGNSTTKTRVFGSLAVSTNDAFIGTQLLHVEGNAKINGDLTIVPSCSESHIERFDYEH
jgi:hypothetical protein